MINFNLKQTISEKEKLFKRQKLVNAFCVQPVKLAALFSTQLNLDQVALKNCENMIGSVEVPVGVAGHLQIDWQGCKQEVLLPLATTEGALIASVARGCKAINQAGGAVIFVDYQGMTRAPVFELTSGQEAREFVIWLKQNLAAIKKVTQSTSKHLKFQSLQTWVRGNLVFVRFLFNTDQAMGMNMITIALNVLYQKLISKKTKAKMIAVSGNVCTDKKDSAINRLLGRGYQTQAEVVLTANILNKVLHTSAEQMFKLHLAKNLVGSNVAGSFSQNMHVANIAAAMFLATGQDVAQVVEASQASTFLEVRKDDLYMAVNLPNLDLGVVGGGTALQAQTQAREIIFGKSKQSLTARDLAAVIAGAVLAGEISGMAALASNSLAQAHQKLGR